MAQGKGLQFYVRLLAVLALGCGGNSGNAYPAAAAALVGTVGATAIYRAQTGGCWAVCSPGYACDRKRGTCYRTECVPACAANESCFVEADNSFRCVDTLGSMRFGANPSAPITSSAPVSSAAPPASSAPLN